MGHERRPCRGPGLAPAIRAASMLGRADGRDAQDDIEGVDSATRTDLAVSKEESDALHADL